MAKIVKTKKNGSVSQSSALSNAQKQEIERLAYQFFLERGGEHGHDQEDWARAEAIVRSKRSR